MASLITPITILLGWAVVNDLQDFRENRKDRAARLDVLRDRVRSVAERAIKFHTEKFDAEAELFLTADLALLAREVNLLSDTDYLALSCENELIDLRKACTGQNATLSDHVKLEYNDIVCINIMRSREAMDARISENTISIVTANRSVITSLKLAVWNPIQNLFRRFKSWANSHDDDDFID